MTNNKPMLPWVEEFMMLYNSNLKLLDVCNRFKEYAENKQKEWEARLDEKNTEVKP